MSGREEEGIEESTGWIVVMQLFESFDFLQKSNPESSVLPCFLLLSNSHGFQIHRFLVILTCYYIRFLGGLGVTCSSRDPRFDGFFQDVNILSTSPPEGTLSRGLRVLRLVKEPQV